MALCVAGFGRAPGPTAEPERDADSERGRLRDGRAPGPTAEPGVLSPSPAAHIS
jgi:hypothetical protein